MKRIAWWGELIAGLGLMTVGFLQACSLTFGKSIISMVLWPTIGLSAILCLYRFIHLPRYWKSRQFWVIVAFCLSFLLSTVLNMAYGWYDNLRTLVMQGILFFLIYCYRPDQREETLRRNHIFTGYYLIACAILSLVGFGYMILGKGEIFFPAEEAVPLYYTGFHWGRLYGIYWDPNIGALMCCLSAVLALDIFRRRKLLWMRLVLGFLVALDVLYIAFSDSRTGQVALAVGMGAYVLLRMSRSKWKKYTVVGVAVALAVSALLPVGIKAGYNALATTTASEPAGAPEETASGPEEPAAEPATEPATEPAVVVGREEEYQGDISNRRLDIWKSALDIFATSPAFGVGHNTILAYVEQNLPDSYLINNDHMRFESMHNTFLDVLVAQGAVGLILYLMMAIGFFVTIIKHWEKICQVTNGESYALFAILIAMVAASFFLSEIVYVCSPMSFLFWMALGSLMQATQVENTEKT